VTEAKVLETPRIIPPTDWEMLRKVRDKHVPKQDAYARAFLSELADRLESEAARNARLCAKLKDLSRRAKAGELDMPNNALHVQPGREAGGL
jgi:hypothetical protein